MPTYFFNTADGSRDVDTEGVVLEDEAAAREEAVRFAGGVIHDDPEVLEESAQFVVEVLDEDRRLLFTVSTNLTDRR